MSLIRCLLRTYQTDAIDVGASAGGAIHCLGSWRGQEMLGHLQDTEAVSRGTIKGFCNGHQVEPPSPHQRTGQYCSQVARLTLVRSTVRASPLKLCIMLGIGKIGTATRVAGDIECLGETCGTQLADSSRQESWSTGMTDGVGVGAEQHGVLEPSEALHEVYMYSSVR